jgi:hypothetical protein
MRITRHGQDRAMERLGVDMNKFAHLLAAQGLTLPDGNHRTEMGTLVVKDGALVTVLAPDMVAVTRQGGHRGR